MLRAAAILDQETCNTFLTVDPVRAQSVLNYDPVLLYNKCCGSMKFWYGSGCESGDLYL